MSSGIKGHGFRSGTRRYILHDTFPWLDWARSANDRRQKFDLLGSFEPADLFSLGVALQAYSGKPVNVITGVDANGDGIFNDRPHGGLAARNTLHGGLLNVDINVTHDFHSAKKRKTAAY